MINTPHLEIISSKYLEDKKCGDLIIQNRNTEKIMKIEFECRNSFAFNQNFNAKFPTVDIPMKKLEKIKNSLQVFVDILSKDQQISIKNVDLRQHNQIIINEQ